jgi:hypothetical protein
MRANSAALVGLKMIWKGLMQGSAVMDRSVDWGARKPECRTTPPTAKWREPNEAIPRVNAEKDTHHNHAFMGSH